MRLLNSPHFKGALFNLLARFGPRASIVPNYSSCAFFNASAPGAPVAAEVACNSRAHHRLLPATSVSPPPPIAAATMASPPEPEPDAGGLTDYERRRAENIRRNGVILDSLRRKAAELSAIIQLSRPPPPRSSSPARAPAPRPPSCAAPSARRAFLHLPPPGQRQRHLAAAPGSPRPSPPPSSTPPLPPRPRPRSATTASTPGRSWC